MFYCILIALARAGPAFAADDPPAGLYESVKRAAVEVLVDGHMESSGWIAEAEGIVVTVAHINATPRKRVEVLLPGMERVEASVVAVDRGRDLLLLRLPARPEPYPALKLAEKLPPAGTAIFLHAAPIYRHAVLLRGAVARNGATFEYYSTQKQYVEVVHITGPAVRGTSGGPWVDAHGDIVGMQSGIMTENSNPVGIAYAVPVDFIRALLREKHSAETPTAGTAVEEVWQQQRDYLKRLPARTEGLVVRVPRADGPVIRAGIKEWEVLLEADGRPLRFPDELLRIIRAHKPGDEMKVKVLKPDEHTTREVTIRLGKLEE